MHEPATHSISCAYLHESHGGQVDAVGHVANCPDARYVCAAELVNHDRTASLVNLYAELLWKRRRSASENNIGKAYMGRRDKGDRASTELKESFGFRI